ncbi:AI-2E family transporter [Saccharopolyspora rectivirgula]|jgi:predicted PurR-regulated permease PerM|uniref:AI-2E family transporter n=1 Tax=Saccharopolyspora rectivirgula TaxID=28042 RepID=UPI003C6DF97A
MVSNYKITATDDAASSLPPVLRVSAAVSWRFLVICGAIFVLGQIISRLFVVVIPVAIALLLAALLGPAVGFLARHGVPRALATVVVMVGGLAAVGSVLTFVINAFIQGFPDLQQQVIRSINTLREQLATGPLHLTDQQLGQYLDQAQQWLQRNQAQITSWSLATATTFGNFLTGLLLALFTLIFFLYDGRRLWLFLIKLAPKHVRHRVDLAGCRAFDSLIGFVRGTALVAVVDAVGIGLGLGILGVPLAVPLAALVFLGGFIPIIGAVASGAVAVLVALVTKGWIVALIVVGVVLAVQQLEGNVLQPLLLGRAVKLHALAVVLAVSIGAVVAGIVGALLAVPTVATLNSAIRSLLEEEPTTGEATAAAAEPREPRQSDEDSEEDRSDDEERRDED